MTEEKATVSTLQKFVVIVHFFTPEGLKALDSRFGRHFEDTFDSESPWDVLVDPNQEPPRTLGTAIELVVDGYEETFNFVNTHVESIDTIYDIMEEIKTRLNPPAEPEPDHKD